MPYFSHGRLVGVAMGWTAWVGYSTAAPIEVLATLKYLDQWLPFIREADGSGLTGAGILISAALLAVMVLINAWGVAFFIRVNTSITWFKIAIPVVVAVAIIGARFDFANLSTPSYTPYGWTGVLSGVSTGGVIFAFIGFRHAIDMAGEVRNPQWTIPLALIGSILFCFVIYALAQIAFLGAVTPADIAGGWKNLKFSHDYGPFAAIGIALGMTWLVSVIFAGAIIAPFGGGLVSTGSNARLALALGESGMFPRAIAALSPRGVPLNGLILNFVIGVVLVVVMSFDELVTLNGAAIVLSFLAGPIALLALRAQLPDRARLFKLPAAAPVGAAAFVAATWTLYWSGWHTTWVLGLALLAGLVLFLLMREKVGAEGSLDLPQARWLPAYLLGLGVLSYLGNFGGGIGAIPFGWDLLAGAALGVASFAQAYRDRLPADHVAANLREIEGEVD